MAANLEPPGYYTELHKGVQSFTKGQAYVNLHTVTIYVNASFLRIGFDTDVRTGSDFDDSFKGKIDDMRIYHRVLSLREIKRIYRN